MKQTPMDNQAEEAGGSRRTKIVWGALLASMTLVGGLLAVLEGDPAPRLDGLVLASSVPAAGATPIEVIFDTRETIEAGRWDGIVIHHSGSLVGSAASLSELHQSQKLHGLGYHFVVSNGSGADDGELHVGYRWLDQLAGAHTGGPGQDTYNRRYIGICLIGDGNRRPFTQSQLRRLGQVVESLQRRLDIPDEHVVLHRDVAETMSPGRLFPAGSFHAMLRDAGSGLRAGI